MLTRYYLIRQLPGNIPATATFPGRGRHININLPQKGNIIMELESILSRVDHTLLSPAATWEEIKKICDDGMKYKTASVCIPPSFVKDAAQYVNGRLTICTVIGFPNGYCTTAVKCCETEDAVNNGAGEIDMVINIGWLKEGKYSELLSEINAVKASCKGKLLKVIIDMPATSPNVPSFLPL